MDPRQKVTCGKAVVAMVLNTLGFVDRPLYLFPEFMVTKPVEILIREDNLPVFIQALKCNTSDKNHFREIVKEDGRSLQEK